MPNPQNAPGSKNPSNFRGSFMPPNQFQYDFTNPEAALQSLASRYTPPPSGGMRPINQQAQPRPQMMAPPQATLPAGATSNTTPAQDPRSSQAESTFQAQAPAAPPARKTRWEIEREAAQAQYEAEIARHNEVSASGGYIHPATANRPFEKLQNRLGYLATMEKQEERRKTDDDKTQRLKAKWASQGETARLRRESNATAKASTQTTTTDTTAVPNDIYYGQQNAKDFVGPPEPDPLAGIRAAVQGATSQTPSAKLAEIAAPEAPASRMPEAPASRMPVAQAQTDRRAFEVPKEPTYAEVREAMLRDNFNPYASNDALRDNTSGFNPKPYVDPSLPAIEAPGGALPQGVRKSFLEQLADRTFGPGGLVGPALPADIAQDRLSRAQTQAERDDARLSALAGEQQDAIQTAMGAVGATGLRTAQTPLKPQPQKTQQPPPRGMLIPETIGGPRPPGTRQVDPVKAVLPRQQAVRKPVPNQMNDVEPALPRQSTAKAPPKAAPVGPRVPEGQVKTGSVASQAKGTIPVVPDATPATPAKPTGPQMFNWLDQLKPKVAKGIRQELQKLENKFVNKEITLEEYTKLREKYHDKLFEKWSPKLVDVDANPTFSPPSKKKMSEPDLAPELFRQTQTMSGMKTPAEKLAHLEKEGVLVKMGNSLVVDHEQRLMVLARINGVEIPFYMSTGMAGKKGVPSGSWYPVFGVTKDGWIIKGSTKEIQNNYGSPKLTQFKEFLDANFKDLPEGSMTFSKTPGIEGERTAYRNHGLAEQTRTGMVSPYIDPAGYAKANKTGFEVLSNLNKGAARDFLPSSGKALNDFMTSVVDQIEGR